MLKGVRIAKMYVICVCKAYLDELMYLAARCFSTRLMMTTTFLATS
jgi:hypothetical protein